MSIQRRASNAKRRSTHDFNESSEEPNVEAVIPMAIAITEEAFFKSDLRQPNNSKGKTGIKKNNSNELVQDKPATTASKPTHVSSISNLESASHHSNSTSLHWPVKLRDTVVSNFDRKLNETECHKFLEKHKWPRGLIKALIKNCKKIPIRFFIVDDSGSMSTNDGKRILNSATPNPKVINCTRWAELCESLKFHAELSEVLGAPSEFRLLNGADPVMVGLDSGHDGGESLAFAREVFSEDPAGQTPLCAHINRVVDAITSMKDELRGNGQKAAVIIATDGLSTDGDVAEAMKALQYLPVWVVIRLCTGEAHVVDYWDNIDKQLELELDVIDDITCDGQQVGKVNEWITYGEPLHRLREFGAAIKEMDLIDESQLSSEQMRSMCAYLLAGGDISAIPHPDEDWNEFMKVIIGYCLKEPKVFCPLTETFQPWVSPEKLTKVYNPKKSMTNSSSCVVC